MASFDSGHRTHATDRLAARPTPEGGDLLRDVPGLQWLLLQVGVEDLDWHVDQWAERLRDEGLLDPSSASQNATDVARSWVNRTHDRLDPLLIELFLFDYWFSRYPHDISRQLPGGYRFDKTLHTIHQLLASKLYDQGKDLTWTRPYTMCRTLQLSKIYFKRVIAADHLVSNKARYQFLGKYAVASALRSRCLNVPLDELLEAEECLRSSIESGNDDPESYAYLAELRLRQYDVCKDSEILKSALKELRNSPTRIASLHLHEAEMWMKLSAATAYESTRISFLTHARNSCDAAYPSSRRPDQLARKALISSFVCHLHTATLKDAGGYLAGLRLPFGLAEALHGCGSLEHPLALITLAVLRDMEASASFVSDEPLFRRIVADGYAALSEFDPRAESSREFLEHALDARNGRRAESILRDDASIMGQASNLLEVGAHRGDKRREAVAMLLRIAAANRNLASPFVLIGRDLELQGPLPMMAPQLESRTVDSRWMFAIRAGNYSFYYELAATRALSSRDLKRSRLGGRGAVMTVEDHFGIVANKFVFKGTTRVNSAREVERIKSLGKSLPADDRFAVPEVMLTVDRPPRDPAFSGSIDVVSLQRYDEGKPAAEVCCKVVGEARLKILMDCCEFLALMHSDIAFRSIPEIGVRKQIKEHDLGLWLKSIVGRQKYLPLYDEWWALASTLPTVPKRDAHLGNWLVARSGRVTAIDLESAGYRPVGYELAQLTDDVAVFGCTAEDWAIRISLLRTYCAQLFPNVEESLVRRGYAIGLIARSIRLLVSGEDDPSYRYRGFELLNLVAEQSESDIANLARRWHELMMQYLGGSTNRLSKGKRIALSKTLSFILRHDSDGQADDNGWQLIDEVVERSRSIGRRMTRDELISVASAPHELRFELSGNKIRARYGHTFKVDANYISPTIVPDLYHSTSTDALNRVFSASRGLLPMDRQWVHLSDDPEVALRVGARKSSPLLLKVEGGENLLQFGQASPKTWVAKSVPSSVLKIVTVMEQLWLGLLELDS